MAEPILTDLEIRLNQTAQDGRDVANQKLASLKDGGYVAVWQEAAQPSPDGGAMWNLKAQIFNADGSRRGSELTVATSIDSQGTHSHEIPDVTSLADGRFVVVWNQVGDTTTPLSSLVKVCIYNANGVPGRVEILPDNIGTLKANIAVSAREDGGFAVGYTRLNYKDAEGNPRPDDDPALDVQYQLFSSMGTRSGNPVVAIDNPTGEQWGGGFAVLNNGNVVTVYGDASDQSIRMRVTTPQGVSVTGPEDPALSSALEDVRIEASVKALADGRFVIVWMHAAALEGDGSGTSIRAQIFYADGSPATEEIQVNQSTTFDQRSPVVVALPGGGFAVAYYDEGPDDGSSEGVEHVRVGAFDAQGQSLGAEVGVGLGPATIIRNGQLMAMEDGRLVVSWQDATLMSTEDPETGEPVFVDDGSGGVRARYINLPLTALVTEGTDLDDVMIGTQIADRIAGGDGNDRIRSGAGNDEIAGGDGNDMLTGEVGNDVIAGGDGTDALAGGAGDDTLDGGEGTDVLDGGEGTDLVSYAAADEGITVSLAAPAGDTLISIEAVEGSLYDDAITGDAAANVLRGGNGSDTLDGGAGADRLEGGLGNDTFLVDSAADQVIEAAGGGRDTILAQASYALSLTSEVEALLAANLSGGDALRLTGSNSANTITGNAGANTLLGLSGADRLRGNAGNDTLDGGADADMLAGGLGKDKLTGGTGKDVFVFDTRLGKSNVDKISQFSVKDDSVYLDNAIFKALGRGTEAKPGRLKKDMFAIGTEAADASDRVIYDNKSGKLFYDADGADGRAQVLIAQLSRGLKMTEKDFFVI
ncbi:MAG TPA: calcium-binding protein [Microvirga sp.]|jgi:Ca2+-binding RTX toxin-like protein